VIETTTLPAPSGAHQRLARQMIERRRLRARFFDSQFFGEQGWDLLLLLFAHQSQPISVDEAGEALQSGASTVMVMARLLASHGLVTLEDSLGRWDEIPIRLSAEGGRKVADYLDQVDHAGLLG